MAWIHDYSINEWLIFLLISRFPTATFLCQTSPQFTWSPLMNRDLCWIFKIRSIRRSSVKHRGLHISLEWHFFPFRINTYCLNCTCCFWVAGKKHSLVEVDSFLGELSWSVHGILIWLILDHLDPFPTLTLLMTMFADHIELTNPVLKDKQEAEK